MKKVKKMGMGGMPGTPVVNKAMPLPPGVPPTLMGLASMGRGPMGRGPMGRGPMGGGPRGPMGGMPMGGIPGNPGFPASAGMPTGAAPLQTLSGILQGQPAKPMKNGGMTASKRADGCAQRGKTKGKMV